MMLRVGLTRGRPDPFETPRIPQKQARHREAAGHHVEMFSG